ncbi:MAG: galactokinase [Chloroflexi bacterium]|nr:galactokinase [Chloroflexota bacterium]
MADLARDRASLIAALMESEPVAAVEPDRIRVVHAPGRVNLLGEHTDYNQGFVLPVAISLGISIALVATDDRRVELTLAATGERGVVELDAIGDRRGTWIDYVRGTAWALIEAGLPVHGFRGLLASDLPAGSGLSSSAALELASAWALSGGEPPPSDPLGLARIAQRGENVYVGVGSGLMDQFASSCGVAGAALLLDCRSLEWHAVPIPPDLRIVVCHTGSTRRLNGSSYNARVAECRRAVQAIAAVEGPAVATLRDVDAAMLARNADRLDPIARRRAEHIVAENGRVLEAEAALRSDDAGAIRELFAASHASMRDLFEISSPELDALVEIASPVPGVIGARMTGGGFGGCTVNLVRPEAVERLREAVERDYPARTGRSPRVWEVDAVAGADVVA